MIDAEAWKRLSALIDEAWALDEPGRAAWLSDLGAKDPELAARVARALDEDGADGTVDGVTTEPVRPHDVLRHAYELGLAPALAGTAEAVARDLAGARLGAWRLEAKIGEGGMGQVWRARRDDGLYQGDAAIKLLRGEHASAAVAARFARERALLARLQHPAIARLLDAGVADADVPGLAGQAYLVLELVVGDALNHHVRAQVPGLAGRVRLLVRVAEAVEYAHARLVVHRDLKPSNVLVTAEGNPKLLDFGIAALLDEDDGATSAGELTRITGRGLTLGYAAPEQITGAPIGTAADVFSLGVMLFELCCGCPPFGPRTLGRAALEHAVLNDQPRRMADAAASRDAVADPLGPGRPQDVAQVRGDLEAIAAKALRRDPAERYASVRAFVDDLQAWLHHRPVTARRDNWRHNTRLWLRRNAYVSAGVALVIVSLGAGLGSALWQRNRAVQAVSTSDEVTQYLEDLLASASPDQHGGTWPTVLQLLEKSRAELPTRFADSPDTRLRVLSVLVGAYRKMNRLDAAIPLAQELLEGSLARYGAADGRTLDARFELGHSQQLQGQCDLALATVQPALPLFLSLPGDPPDGLGLQALSVVAHCLQRVGRLEEAEALLAEERRRVDRLPPGDRWNYGYANHLHGLRLAQGRVREALSVMRAVEPFWASTAPGDQREIANQQRNVMALQIRLADYGGLEPRLEALIDRVDGLLGPAASLGLLARLDLARLRLETGRYVLALAQVEATLAHAEAAHVSAPAVLLPLRARVLLARAMAAAAPRGDLLHQTRRLLDEVEPLRAVLGAQRAEVWVAAARTALAVDDADLAAQVMDRMAADAGLHLAPGLAQDPQLLARRLQLDGQLARLRGDLEASRRALQARLATFDGMDERRQVLAWSAALDLAYTLVLAGAPEAAAALEDAATRRPGAVPPSHPLDIAADYLRARMAAGRDDDPRVLKARTLLWQAQRRGGSPAQRPEPRLRAALGGVLL